MSEQPMITFASHEARVGRVGASEDFEQMLGLLIRATMGEANLVFANPGDWGIDVIVGDLGGGRVTIWQAKYFARGVDRSQQGQIISSFASARGAARDHGYTLERWVLCIPVSMDGPALQWWQGWRTRQEQVTGVVVELWDETRLRELLLRPEAGNVRRHYYNPYREDGRTRAHGAIQNPYRGLQSFREEDELLFFGRESAVTEVLDRMAQLPENASLLIVSGASGTGKSSLMQAGVIPRLKREGRSSAPAAVYCPVVILTPGPRPLEELAAHVAPLAGTDATTVLANLTAAPGGFGLTARQMALAGQADPPSAEAAVDWVGSRRVVLVVDQFEQLFTQCENEDDRQAFIAALHAAATVRHGGEQRTAALVVLVIRADFEVRASAYPRLAVAVQNRYLLTGLTERQLRMAITEPAMVAGSTVDSGLVHVLLDEARSQGSGPAPVGFAAGILPLLSHALDQAWRNRAGNVLTLADYERVGGIDGAVASSAQGAYDKLTSAQQNIARQVFIRLTATSSDGIDTSARVQRADLLSTSPMPQARDVEAVLEAFAGARLLTLAADTVEISHEALLTAWPLLRDTWLADSHADRLVRTRLRTAADEWFRASHDPAFLYSGTRLVTAIDAARQGAGGHDAAFSQLEADFLSASQRAGRRRLRRAQALTAFLVALVVALAAVAVAAIRASDDAIRARDDAARQRDIAISDQLISESENSAASNATLARLESIAAWTIDPSSQARYAMLSAAATPEIASMTSDGSGIPSMTLSSDGKTLVVGTSAGNVWLRKGADGRLIRAPINVYGKKDTVVVALSPDGKVLATGNVADSVFGESTGKVWLWDAATLKRLGGPIPVRGGVASLAFGPDGKTLAIGIAGADDVQLWDPATLQPIGRPFAGGSGDAMSPHGGILVTDDGTPDAPVWDIASHAKIGALTSPDGINSVVFSPDGTTLAANEGNAVQLWNTTTIRPGPLFQVSGGVEGMAFSPDSRILATGNGDGTAQLWRVADGQQVGSTLSAATGSVISVAFSPDGGTLLTGDNQGIVRLWDLAVGPENGAVLADSSNAETRAIAFSPDGKMMGAGDHAGSVLVWSTATRRRIAVLHSGIDQGPDSVVFSPDSKMLAVSGANGDLQLWNLTSRRKIMTLPNSQGVDELAFSPDGRMIAGTLSAPVEDQASVQLWNVKSAQQIGSINSSSASGSVGLYPVAFSPDGNTLVIIDSANGTAQLWDITTRRRVGVMSVGRGAGSVAYSPGGGTFAVGNSDGTVSLWNIVTRKQVGPVIADDPEGISSLAFSPDGKTIVTGDSVGTIRLWDVTTRQQIGPSLSGGNGYESVAFSPDGRIVLSGDSYGAARLWNVYYLPDVLTQLCADVGGSITRAQWMEFVPTGPAYRNACPP